MGPEDLAQVLRHLPPIVDPSVLVGTETSDDAAVYKLTEDIAIVLTVDYFTPIVDDPYIFGQIAAANALSDVYAMGGRPLAMLSIAGFPRDKLPLSVLEAMLRGGADKAKEAGIHVVGGHTIADSEPKCGYAVVGLVHPQKIWKNVGARPGDRLILTKPLGTGIISTAVKKQRAPAASIEAATKTMLVLNRAAAEALSAVGGAHAVTDVTGFGLLGHLREMTQGSKVHARLAVRDVPFLPEVFELVREDFVPGGTKRNLRSLADVVRWDASVTREQQLALADAQTSGGLLIAIPADRVDQLLAELAKRGVEPKTIGSITDDDPVGGIDVLP